MLGLLLFTLPLAVIGFPQGLPELVPEPLEPAPFPLPGAPVKVAELDEDQQEVANFAFSELSSRIEAQLDGCKANLVRVEDFSQQTVAGYLYKFALVFHHDESCSYDSGESRCELVVFEDVEGIREVQWENVKCDEDQYEYDNGEEPLIVGAPTQVEELDEDQQEIANFAFSQLSSRPGAPVGCTKNLLRVENFSQQVVQGILYKFDLIMQHDSSCTNDESENKCSLTVWEKSWENYREVQWDDVRCDGDENQDYYDNEEPFIVGGLQQVAELDEDQQEIANFAFSQLSSRPGAPVGCAKNLLRVENFSQQVVQGILYKFDLIMQHDSSCTNDQSESKCSLTVWEKSWENYREVQWDDVRCDGDENQDYYDNEEPFIVGAPKQVAELDADQQEIADFAFSQLSSRPGAPVGCAKNLLRVENFSQQVVQGILYKFDLIMQHDSSCTNDKSESKCSLTVWEKSWENYREVQWDDVRCDGDENEDNYENEDEEDYSNYPIVG